VVLASIALFQVISVGSSLGVETGMVRWVSGRRDMPDRIARRDLLTISLVPVIVFSCLAALATALLSDELGAFMGGDTLNDDASNLILTLSVFVPFAASSMGPLGASRGYGTMRPTVFIDRIGRPIAQLLGVAVTVATNQTLVTIAAVWAAPYVLQLLASLMWLHRIEHADRVAVVRGGGWYESARAFWAFTLPRSVATTFRVTYQWLDVVLVAGLATPELAAVYAVSTRLLQLGVLTAFSVGQAVEPRFC
jgi:O-antigen/teichoic acid export membrane protein